MKYANPSGKKKMGHEKMPKKCNPYKAQKADMGRLREIPHNNRGYPMQAWEYRY